MTLFIIDFTALHIFEIEFFLSYCCCCSVAKSWPTLCDPMDCSTPGFFVLHYLPEISQFMSTESMMLSHPLPLLLLPSIFLSTSISVSLCIPWPKNWSLSFSISLPNEYSGLISFTIDCFHLLAVQETQESSPAPQFESINSLAVSLLYGLTSVHGYWKNHSFDYMGLCWQSDVSAF